MDVTQISIGRFHHFHLSRQLEKNKKLKEIWTGYPKFKLQDEKGIPPEKIKTFPWLQAPFMARGRLALDRWMWLNREWAWYARETLDKHVASKLDEPTTVVALSSSGLHAGKKAQLTGGHYICDRGSSHIRFQDQLLREEHEKWGKEYNGIDPRVIGKEEAEYEQADLITVPSEFARRSFLEMGIPENKIAKVTYGARMDRFSKVDEPSNEQFRILWVGNVSLQKGFLYALEAFHQFTHPKKEFIVVGSITKDLKALLSTKKLEGVTFKGTVPNNKLPGIYSSSNVFVLSSIQEGLAMVQGEALACGCPVIATTNTGASDLYTDGKEGFIVPIRSPEAITERLEELAQNPEKRINMSEAALKRVKKLGGWDTYGDNYVSILKSL